MKIIWCSFSGRLRLLSRVERTLFGWLLCYEREFGKVSFLALAFARTCRNILASNFQTFPFPFQGDLLSFCGKMPSITFPFCPRWDCRVGWPVSLCPCSLGADSGWASHRSPREHRCLSDLAGLPGQELLPASQRTALGGGSCRLSWFWIVCQKVIFRPDSLKKLLALLLNKFEDFFFFFFF